MTRHDSKPLTYTDSLNVSEDPEALPRSLFHPSENTAAERMAISQGPTASVELGLGVCLSPDSFLHSFN